MRFYSLIFVIIFTEILTFDKFPKEVFYKFLAQQEQTEVAAAEASEEKVDPKVDKSQSLQFILGSNPGTTTIINIDYIFGTYNLFFGNPQLLIVTWDDTFDPGFTGRNIFQSSFHQHQVTSDGHYKIPDFVTIQSKKGCKFAYESKVIRTPEQLQRYLSDFVGIDLATSFEYTPWAFTASVEYNQIQQYIEQKIYTFVISTCACKLFKVSLDPSNLPPFTDAFHNAIKELPQEYDPAPYIDFIETYGTHYLKQLYLGSRMGYAYSMAPESMQTSKGEKIFYKWADDELETAATITSQVLKGVIQTQILPRNQSSKAFTDLSKISASTMQIEIGPPSVTPVLREWMEETEREPMPVKYVLGAIADLIDEGKGSLKDIENHQKIAKNLRTAFGDYCKMLSLQNKRYGVCYPQHEQMKEWFEKREVCLSFFDSCDWQGQQQYICGNRNPVQSMIENLKQILFQDVGLQLPEVSASSVKFYSDKTVIIGTTMFTMDYDQSTVLSSFHNDYFFLDKSEACFVNQELGQHARVRVYLTDTSRCLVVLLWNYCPGYAIRYFTSVICNQFDVADNFKSAINEIGSCEVALLDIRFPMPIHLRLCLFKHSKMQGERTCFSSETAEQYYGLSFVSMLIDEEELVVHKAMPGSIVVEFDQSQEKTE